MRPILVQRWREWVYERRIYVHGGVRMTMGSTKVRRCKLLQNGGGLG